MAPKIIIRGKRPAAELRRQAEAKWSEHKKKTGPFPAGEADNLRLVHELEVHQIELEMQNKELAQSRAEVEALLLQYTNLYDFAPVGYFTLARDGAIRQANLAGARLLGVEVGKLVKRRFGVFVSVESRPAFSAFLEKVFTSGGKEACEVALLKDGLGPLWAHIEASTEDEQREACHAVIADITARKRSEEKLVVANKELVFQNEEKEKWVAELTRSKHFLDEAGRLARIGSWEIDLKNNELSWSDEVYQIYEVGSDYQPTVESAINFYTPEAIPLISEAVNRAIKEGKSYDIDLQLITAKQNRIWVRTIGQAYRVNGEIVKIGGVFQDINERKIAEQGLIIANKELAFQNEEKKKRADELIIANEETTHQLQNIQALYTIDQVITGSFDLDLTLNVLLEQIKTQLNVDAAAVLLLNPHAQVLEFAAGIGFRGKEIEHSRLHLGEGHCGRVALERKTASAINLLKKDTQLISAPFLGDEGFATYSGTPLIAKGQVIGVLEVYHRSPFEPDENWLEFFKVLAGQTAIAVDSANLFTELRLSNTKLFMAYDSTIEGWSHALDLRDKETEGHTQRVTEMTLKLARAAGITEEELVHVRRGALLHDIGKMGVPDNILLKPDKLTDEEWVVMRKHTTFAFELLSPIAYLRPALDIPYCHHEKWDGTGYPRGLKGTQIPLIARIFAVVDVWDALKSDRPYRAGWTEEKVLEHIRTLSGTHFDPQVVDAFMQIQNLI